MSRFQYQATDEKGQPVSGELNAPSLEVAREELQHRGWQVEQLAALPEAQAASFAGEGPKTPSTLRDVDASWIASQMANVTAAGLPLSAGLRALSEEVPSHRVRLWLRAISERLDHGQSLDSLARDVAGRWPRYFLAMLVAGQRTGKLPELLNECVIHLRSIAEIRRQLWLALTYPSILLLTAWLLMSFLASTIAPKFREIFDGFGVKLPGLTAVILDWASVMEYVCWWGLPALILLLVVVWHVSELTGHEQTRDAFVSKIPLLGEARRAASLAEFCRILSLLVKYEVRLAEAVRLAAGSLRDADLREACFALATRVEAGETLSAAVQHSGRFSHELQQVFCWADRDENFADGLQHAGDLLNLQSRVQSHALSVFCEPATTIVIGAIVALTVLALFMPLVKLMNDLS